MIVPLRPTTAQHAIHRFLQHPLPELLHALPGEDFQRVEPKVTPSSPYLPSRFVGHFLNRFLRPCDRSRPSCRILCATAAAALERPLLTFCAYRPTADPVPLTSPAAPSSCEARLSLPFVARGGTAGSQGLDDRRGYLSRADTPGKYPRMAAR